MRRCRKRVRLDIVIGVAQEVGQEEHRNGEDHQIDAQSETVFRGVIGVERNGVRFRFDLYARRVGRPRNVQRSDVQDNDTGNYERQQIVEREETV